MKLRKGTDPRAFAEAVEALSDAETLEQAADRVLAIADRSKAARRGVAAALVGHPVLAALAQRAGDATADPDPERLLRRAEGRDADARRRINPIRRNEAFACEHCGHEVPAAPGAGVRNHCPRCLRSKHVDGEVPGDRESSCGGLMDPVGWDGSGGRRRVLLRCRRCGHERPNRLRSDWACDPDREDALRRLGGL